LSNGGLQSRLCPTGYSRSELNRIVSLGSQKTEQTSEQRSVSASEARWVVDLQSVAFSNGLRASLLRLSFLRPSISPFTSDPGAEPSRGGGGPPSRSSGCLLLDAASFEESLVVKGLRTGWLLRLLWSERGMTGMIGTTARGLVLVTL